jgi:hypothetical protein
MEILTLSAASRVAKLICGIAYLGGLSWIFSAITQTPYVIAAAMIFAGSAVIMASLGAFCVKLVDHSRRRSRIGLSTILLAFVPVSVYLAGIQQIIHIARASGGPEIPWVLVAGLLLLGVVFNTVVLLIMGEAIAWLAVRVMKARQRSSHDRQGDL